MAGPKKREKKKTMRAKAQKIESEAVKREYAEQQVQKALKAREGRDDALIVLNEKKLAAKLKAEEDKKKLRAKAAADAQKKERDEKKNLIKERRLQHKANLQKKQRPPTPPSSSSDEDDQEDDDESSSDEPIQQSRRKYVAESSDDDSSNDDDESNDDDDDDDDDDEDEDEEEFDLEAALRAEREEAGLSKASSKKKSKSEPEPEPEPIKKLPALTKQAASLAKTAKSQSNAAKDKARQQVILPAEDDSDNEPEISFNAEDVVPYNVGVVYIGRIPRGFFEDQMRAFFSQFGRVVNVRMARNKKTGKSKHYAFVQFENDVVADIVAQAMHNYLLFGHILQCKLMPHDEVHPNIWKGANSKYIVINHSRKAAVLYNRTEVNPESYARRIKRLKRHDSALQAQLKARGIDYELPPWDNEPVENKPAKKQRTANGSKSVKKDFSSDSSSDSDEPIPTKSSNAKSKKTSLVGTPKKSIPEASASSESSNKKSKPLVVSALPKSTSKPTVQPSLPHRSTSTKSLVSSSSTSSSSSSSTTTPSKKSSIPSTPSKKSSIASTPSKKSTSHPKKRVDTPDPRRR